MCTDVRFFIINKWVLSLDLRTVSDGLSRTVLGSEFQTAGAEWQNPRAAKSVLEEGRDSKGVLDRDRPTPISLVSAVAKTVAETRDTYTAVTET